MYIKKLMRLSAVAMAASMLVATPQFLSAAKAEYPERSIEVVVKAGPGSGANQLGHLVAKLAPEFLGQSMAVVYKAGGSGAVAQAYVQARPAEGYQIFLDTTTTAIVLARSGSDFSEGDWRGVMRLQVDPQGLAVRADSPWKNFSQLVDWVKQNPGKLRWAGAHAVGTDPLTVSKLLASADLKSSDVSYVPMKGANEMVSGLLGGHFDAATLNPAEAAEQVEAGKLRVLGIAYADRIDQFPEWQTFKEQGFDVEQAIWRGVLVKTGTPDEVVDKIHEALLKVRELPEFKKFMKDQLQVDGYMGGPKKFDAFFKSEVEELRKAFAEK